MNSNLRVNKFAALFAFSFTGNGSGMALAFVCGEGCRAVYFYGSVYLTVALISASTLILIF